MTHPTSPFDPTFSLARNAHVDTAHFGRATYANGYFLAAELLAKHACEDRLDRNFLVFPICYLYRHNIELQLKDLIVVARRVVKPVTEKVTHHRIKDLWALARQLLGEADLGKPYPEEFKEVDRLIDYFAGVDDDAQAFRFPTKMNGDRSLADISEIDLESLRDQVNSVTLYLWGCIDWLDDLGQQP